MNKYFFYLQINFHDFREFTTGFQNPMRISFAWISISVIRFKSSYLFLNLDRITDFVFSKRCSWPCRDANFDYLQFSLWFVHWRARVWVAAANDISPRRKPIFKLTHSQIGPCIVERFSCGIFGSILLLLRSRLQVLFHLRSVFRLISFSYSFRFYRSAIRFSAFHSFGSVLWF